MESLSLALEPYRHLDARGWLGVYRLVPPAVGMAVAALGVLLLLFGGRRLFRLVAAPLGAGLALVWTEALAARLGAPSLPGFVEPAVAGAMAVAGLAFPPLVVFFAFGIPAGLLAGELVGKADWLLGFAPGFLGGGALGVALHQVVGILLSAALGAWLVLLGALAAAGPSVAWAAWLATSPAAAFAVAGALAAGGAAYQFSAHASDGDAARAGRARARKLDRDPAEPLERRWTKYGKKA